MPDRLTALSTAANPVTGAAYLDDVGDEIRSLWDRVHSVLQAIGGTANAVTATVDPPLGSRGLRPGMLFLLQAANSNTGAMTLSIGGLAASPIVQMTGAPLVAGQVIAGASYLLAWTGAAYVLLTATQQPKISNRQIFTAQGSFTWTKPGGCPDDALVLVRLWGGGGAGTRVLTAGFGNSMGTGGGGGAYFEEWRRAGDLASSVSGYVGAGGALGAYAGGDGEASTFAGASAPGGGGGRQLLSTSAGTVTEGGPGGVAPGWPGGAGATAARHTLNGWPNSWAIGTASAAWSGGGAGGGAQNGNSGNYINASAASGSTRGGAGGAPGQPGIAPAGGGGVDGIGGRGRAEIIVTG